MHLHAVLGFSFTPLASAMLLEEVEYVTLYCDNIDRAELFRKNFKEVILQRNNDLNTPEISIKLIPNLNDDIGSDMISMIEALQRDKALRELDVGAEDVLFFSGTPGHVYSFSTFFKFSQLMTFEKGPKIVIIGTEEKREVTGFFDLTLSEILQLHDLSEEICYGKEKHHSEKRIWDARYVKDIFLEGTEIIFQYVDSINEQVTSENNGGVDYQKGGSRRKFCSYVRKVESYLSKYGVIHRVNNDMLEHWLKNTQIPPQFLYSEEEEE